VGTMTIPIALVKELPIPILNNNILKKCGKKYQEIEQLRENKQDEKVQQIKDKICRELENLIRENNESPKR